MIVYQPIIELVEYMIISLVLANKTDLCRFGATFLRQQELYMKASLYIKSTSYRTQGAEQVSLVI